LNALKSFLRHLNIKVNKVIVYNLLLNIQFHIIAIKTCKNVDFGRYSKNFKKCQKNDARESILSHFLKKDI